MAGSSSSSSAAAASHSAPQAVATSSTVPNRANVPALAAMTTTTAGPMAGDAAVGESSSLSANGGLQRRGPRHGCRDISSFGLRDKVGEGTFGDVSVTTDEQHGLKVALKRVKFVNKAVLEEGFPRVALREIRLLQLLRHPNIVTLREVVTDKSSIGTIHGGDAFLCLDFAEADMQGLMGLSTFKMTEEHVRCYMYQVFQGLAFMHSKGVLHRDIKPANILVQRNNVVKIADFGISKQLRAGAKKQVVDPVYMASITGSGTAPAAIATAKPQPEKNSARKDRQRLTDGDRVQTLPYRAPEVFLGEQYYTGAVDVWSCGITLACLLAEGAVFPIHVQEHKQNSAHMAWIWQLVGTDRWPKARALPKYTQFRPVEAVASHAGTGTTSMWRRQFGTFSPAAQDLLKVLLHPDPEKRITALNAMSHDFFWPSPAAPSPASLPPLDMKNAHDAGVRAIEREARMQARQRARAAAMGRTAPSVSASVGRRDPSRSMEAPGASGPSVSISPRRQEGGVSPSLGSQPGGRASAQPGASYSPVAVSRGPSLAAEAQSSSSSSSASAGESRLGPSKLGPTRDGSVPRPGAMPSASARLPENVVGRALASVASHTSRGSVGRDSTSMRRFNPTASMSRGMSEARSASRGGSIGRSISRGGGLAGLTLNSKRTNKRPRENGSARSNSSSAAALLSMGSRRGRPAGYRGGRGGSARGGRGGGRGGGVMGGRAGNGRGGRYASHRSNMSLSGTHSNVSLHTKPTADPAAALNRAKAASLQPPAPAPVSLAQARPPAPSSSSAGQP